MNDQKYRSWHPDHRRYVVLKPSADLVGKQIFFEEVLGSEFRIALTWEIVKVDEPRCVIFRALIPYPVSLELHLSENTNGTAVTHWVLIGYKRWFSPALDLLISATVFSRRRCKLLERYVYEEFSNLEVLARRPVVR
jgi:hypothetical protein